VLALARSLGAWFNAEGLAGIEADLGAHPCLVAEEGGRIAGFALWKPAGEDAAELAWMGVAEDLQRRGIGTALLEALCAEAAGAGYAGVRVSTVADSVDYPPYERTRRFYRSRGFRDLRVDRGFFGEGADRYDRLLLARPLGPPGPGSAVGGG
jgi:ribosomal protein S18 acetylase RimI-like enzyme